LIAQETRTPSRSTPYKLLFFRVRFGFAALDLGRDVADEPLAVVRPRATAVGLGELAATLRFPDGDPLPPDGLASESI
jgi:hypothetical protein